MNECKRIIDKRIDNKNKKSLNFLKKIFSKGNLNKFKKNTAL